MWLWVVSDVNELIVVIILQYIKISNDIHLKLIECCVSIILQLKKKRLCYGEHKSVCKIVMSIIDLRKTHTYLGYSTQWPYLIYDTNLKYRSHHFILWWLQFSHSVMSNSLWPHESQHVRPPCPSPTPGVHSNSYPLSWWCHPSISSSVVPFSSCPQSLTASGSFPMNQLFAWGGQSVGFQL